MTFQEWWSRTDHCVVNPYVCSQEKLLAKTAWEAAQKDIMEKFDLIPKKGGEGDPFTPDPDSDLAAIIREGLEDVTKWLRSIRNELIHIDNKIPGRP